MRLDPKEKVCTCFTPETRSAQSSARRLASRLSTVPVSVTSQLATCTSMCDASTKGSSLRRSFTSSRIRSSERVLISGRPAMLAALILPAAALGVLIAEPGGYLVRSPIPEAAVLAVAAPIAGAPASAPRP